MAAQGLGDLEDEKSDNISSSQCFHRIMKYLKIEYGDECTTPLTIYIGVYVFQIM